MEIDSSNLCAARENSDAFEFFSFGIVGQVHRSTGVREPEKEALVEHFRGRLNLELEPIAVLARI